MALNLYRRHLACCVGGRARNARTYESDEQRRAWKRCFCPVYASGTLSGKFQRKNTERIDWAEAKSLANGWEVDASWDGPAKVTAPTPAVPARLDRLIDMGHEAPQGEIKSATIFGSLILTVFESNETPVIHGWYRLFHRVYCITGFRG